MANEISLVTWSGSTVTSLDDALIYEKFAANSGIIEGCEVTLKDASTLHIASGHGIVCGRKFTVTASDIPVALSTGETLLGRLYIHLDLASVSDPITLLTEVAGTLTDEVQESDANINSGVWDMNIATFEVDSVTISNIANIGPEVQNNNKSVATIEDKTESENAYTVGQYLVHHGILRKVTAAISVGDELEEGVNIEATDVGGELSKLNSDVALEDKLIATGTGTTNNQKLASLWNYFLALNGVEIRNAYLMLDNVVRLNLSDVSNGEFTSTFVTTDGTYNYTVIDTISLRSATYRRAAWTNTSMSYLDFSSGTGQDIKLYVAKSK